MSKLTEIDASGETDDVREAISWFLIYFEPSDNSKWGATPYVLEELIRHFGDECSESDLERAETLLKKRASHWMPGEQWRVQPKAPKPTQKPPGFIWLKGLRGYHHGYFRADRIEAVFATRRKMAAANQMHDELVECTQVSMFDSSVLTEETPDEVFAKMADALRIPQKDEP